MNSFRRISRSSVALACALVLLATSVAQVRSQQSAQTKRALTHQDYDTWRSIVSPQISRDGKFVAYAYMAQDADSDVVVRNIASGKEWRAPRGYRPPAPPPDVSIPGSAELVAEQARLVRPWFTADTRFVAFGIEPAKAELNKAKKEKKRPEEMPKTALGLMDLSSGEVAKIDRVKSFQVPEDGSGFIAYLKEAKPSGNPAAKDGADAGKTAVPGPKADPSPLAAEPAPTSSPTARETAIAGKPAPGSSPAVREGANAGRMPAPPTGKKKDYGTDLVLRNTTTGAERTFNDVLDYTLSKDAKTLVFTVSAKKEESNGVYVVSTQSEAAPVAVISGKGKYQKLTWDEEQTELAFVSDRDDAEAKQPKFKVYLWDRGSATTVREGANSNHTSPAAPMPAVEVVSSASPGFRKDFVVSDKANLSFSLDGSRLFLGAAPPPEPEKNADEEVSADEKVIADLWHWKDDYIQPIQRVRAEQERQRSYRAVYLTKEKRFVQLADESMENINPSIDGRFAVGSDNRGYRIESDHNPGYSDFYVINASDGSRKLIRQKQRGVSLSPGAKYAIFFDGKDWNSYSVADGRALNLTKSLGVNFFNEDNDSPDLPGSYGVAGWTKDDREVLIYDRYDVWVVSADGSGAKNLTDGVGRRDKLAFRYVRLDPKERSIDPAKPLLLRADNEETRDEGFYRERIGGGLPEKLLMGAKGYNNPTKAKDADVLMFTASRFDEFLDVWVSDINFKNPRKVSNGDAQRAGFNWGTAELVSFKNTDGVPLKGMLLKPDNFDPKKKYPMLVYIYERLTPGLHGFRAPGPGTSINPSYYVSNGYLVFMPDIVYTTGYPGHSAMKCVLPAIQEVVDRGYVDEKAIGIQGHSWGGYQIAYMVTQTNRFRAAAPGAIVANMTSAYSGIRWGSGLPRQFQYEHSQSRIGGSLWEYPMRFLENSPVFRADRVQTPLLMIHNDEDDAVPWYQGIEFYLALRRLGKEVYMFNYNGERHGLRKRINQKDYTRRLQEFFDHNLKGAPEPEWMKKGIPFLQREKEKEKYRVTTDEEPGH
ncbi:MAG TPA: prolyl oligopeptidase family serine peptidase [Pyrinomonadaceae bacterium]|nr:prolyl oligopeptidase family serine peptidase [Pyrinomonadaceae bacterium]